MRDLRQIIGSAMERVVRIKPRQPKTNARFLGINNLCLDQRYDVSAADISPDGTERRLERQHGSRIRRLGQCFVHASSDSSIFSASTLSASPTCAGTILVSFSVFLQNVLIAGFWLRELSPSEIVGRPSQGLGQERELLRCRRGRPAGTRGAQERGSGLDGTEAC